MLKFNNFKVWIQFEITENFNNKKFQVVSGGPGSHTDNILYLLNIFLILNKNY